ncbi:hypothetical protein GCM10012275_43540 [Longimycelium tulufanense]|uniref:PE family protein n=1 Tax=Longimycelium tulufanense TaxID=907463 RepID=A0A8J3CB49_9PSEU|nr:PE domain-containing protein [Longimycelium tulufanense]GGM68337.1 hypothetical protein GCM10012275_43540 [Longimycelium tulufanense]
MGEMVSGFWAASAVGGAAGAAAAAAGATAHAADAARGASEGGGGSGAGAHFAVDRDQIPGLINDLKEAKVKLEDAANVAKQAANWPAPGNDPYSPSAAKRMGPELVQNYLAANAQQQADIENMIKSLEAAMTSYDNADESARASFQQKRS